MWLVVDQRTTWEKERKHGNRGSTKKVGMSAPTNYENVITFFSFTSLHTLPYICPIIGCALAEGEQRGVPSKAFTALSKTNLLSLSHFDNQLVSAILSVCVPHRGSNMKFLVKRKRSLLYAAFFFYTIPPDSRSCLFQHQRNPTLENEYLKGRRYLRL